MKTWYNSLSPRERTLVLVAGTAMLFLLLWLLVAKPLYSKHKKLNTQISSQKLALETMKKQSLQVRRLKQDNSKHVLKSTGNTQQHIERALQTWRLKSTLERMQSQGPDGVRLILKDANADRFMRFLFELENKYALTISNLVINNAKKEPGFADIRLTIKKS